MNQRQVLKNRIINFIDQTKHKLSHSDQIELFNDLLILRVIVNELPKKSLRNLLKEFKPHNVRSEQGQNHNFFNKGKVMRILSQVQKPSMLLSDFLICGGYSQSQAIYHV